MVAPLTGCVSRDINAVVVCYKRIVAPLTGCVSRNTFKTSPRYSVSMSHLSRGA